MGYSSADPASYLALAKQADASTEATAGFKFVKFLGQSGINPDVESQSVFEGGDGQDQGLHYRQRTKFDGQIVANARPDMFAYLSAWALGSGVAVPSVAAGGLASHVYTPNATVPFLTVEQAWGGGKQIDRVMSAILTGFQVEGQAGQPWQITNPFVGGGTAYYRDGAASALSAVLESGDPAMYAGGAYLIDGATQLDITKWTYNFQRNVDDNLFTVNQFRRKVIPLSRQISVDFQVIWQDQNLWKNIMYGGGSQIPDNLATGAFRAQRILTGSQMVQIDVPLLRYTNVGVNQLVPDGETVVLDISAMGVKGGTGICQHRINTLSSATSYLL
jgi:hypothetical protein